VAPKPGSSRDEIATEGKRKIERREGSKPMMALQQLEASLWGAANILRGKTAGQDYKNYILSLMFFKRLSDQWEHEADEAIAELEEHVRASPSRQRCRRWQPSPSPRPPRPLSLIA
jgi:hypothetical protein